MRIVSTIVVALLAISISSCGGTIIQTIDPSDTAALASSEQLMPYYLPITEIVVTAAFSQGRLKGSAEKTGIVADLSAGPLYLGYQHEGLSNEDVKLAVDDNGLLKSVSSMSQSQVVDFMKATNEILTQFGAFKAAQAASTRSKGESPSLGECDGISMQETISLRTGTYPRAVQTVKGPTKCTLTVSATVEMEPRTIPSVLAARVGRDSKVTDVCRNAVCHRPQSSFIVKLKASLSTNSKSAEGVAANQTIRILAPNPDYLAAIRFSRGVFASRTIGAEFTNGILTSYSSKRTSEVVGFLAVPAVALTTATLIEKLN